MYQKKMIRSFALFVAALSSASHTVTVTSSARAQNAGPASKQAKLMGKSVDATLIKVFHLENLQSEAVVMTIAGLLRSESDLTLTFDSRTNAILARGREPTLRQVEALLHELDREDSAAEPVDERTSITAYPLRFVNAEAAHQVLSQLLEHDNATRISVDQRLNRLLVFGTPTTHKMVQQVLENVDGPDDEARAQTTAIVAAEPNGISQQARMKIMQDVAEQVGVKLDYGPQPDVVAVKGDKSSVASFQTMVEAALRDANARSAESIRTNYAIRVVWLASSEEELQTVQQDDLDPIRKKAEQFGIRNLASIGQLIASTRAEHSQPASFVVRGTVMHGNQEYELSAEGSFAAIDRKRSAFGLRLSIHASPIAEGRDQSNREMIAEVDMQLGVGKPVILATAPIEGKQSVFVVEIEKGL